MNRITYWRIPLFFAFQIYDIHDEKKLLIALAFGFQALLFALSLMTPF